MLRQFVKWKLWSLNTLSDSLNSKSRLSFFIHPTFKSKSVQIFHSDFFINLHTNWYFRWIYRWNWMFIQIFKWKLISLNTLSDSRNSKSRLYKLHINLKFLNEWNHVISSNCINITYQLIQITLQYVSRKTFFQT